MLKKVTITAFGQDYTCTNESGNTWKVSVVTPNTSSYNQEEHYYPIVVKAEDEAGNIKTVDVNDQTLGNLLKLVVKETVAPAINITSPTAGTKTAQKRPTIAFTITDNDSGVDESTVKLTFNGQEYTTSDFTRQTVSGGYKYEYTPDTDLPDDEYTAAVNASDNDGNAATPKSVTFEVYAAAPTLSVTSPAEDLVTNQPTVAYSATTNGGELDSNSKWHTADGQPVWRHSDRNTDAERRRKYHYLHGNVRNGNRNIYYKNGNSGHQSSCYLCD